MIRKRKYGYCTECIVSRTSAACSAAPHRGPETRTQEQDTPLHLPPSHMIVRYGRTIRMQHAVSSARLFVRGLERACVRVTESSRDSINQDDTARFESRVECAVPCGVESSLCRCRLPVPVPQPLPVPVPGPRSRSRVPVVPVRAVTCVCCETDPLGGRSGSVGVDGLGMFGWFNG